MQDFKRVKAIISYDGSYFYGSQTLADQHLPTVLANIQGVLMLLGINTQIIAAGRTDKGVHALRQVISFTIPSFWNNLLSLKNQLNKHLRFIEIKSLSLINDNFHPRFDAKKRMYRYVLSKRKSVFLANLAIFYPNFNLKLMQKAIKIFEGEHDFSKFSKMDKEPKQTIRTILKAFTYETKDLYVLSFLGKAFLRAQIRFMVAHLLAINEGKISVNDTVKKLSGKKDFQLKLAPAQGLYLTRVFY